MSNITILDFMREMNAKQAASQPLKGETWVNFKNLRKRKRRRLHARIPKVLPKEGIELDWDGSLDFE